MYDELKVEARKDVLNDPRILALEEIKNVVFPLMDETVTKGYIDELQKALQMIEEKEDENDRLKAQLKLKEITSTLSPVVAEAVEAFVGEATSEEEVVEKYSKLKNLVKEANDDEEDMDIDMDDEEEDEEEEEGKKKKKKKKKKSEEEDEEAEDEDEDEIEESKNSKKKKSDDDDEEDDDEDEEEDEDEDEDEEEDEEEEMEEDLEINPTVHFDKKEKEAEDFALQLNEMLDLAGIPKD
jgi:hypothetical protein